MKNEVKDVSERTSENNQAESINAKVAEELGSLLDDFRNNADHSKYNVPNLNALPSMEILSNKQSIDNHKSRTAVDEFSKIQDSRGTAIDKFGPVSDSKAGCIKRPLESLIVAGLISDKGNFGNQWDRDRIEKAVETALKEGKINEFMEQANNVLKDENLKLGLTYMYSSKSMPPTVHYSLNLDSADGSTPRLDAMVVQNTDWPNLLRPNSRMGDRVANSSELHSNSADEKPFSETAPERAKLIEVAENGIDELDKSAEQLASFIQESDSDIFGTYADRNQAKKILDKAMEDGYANELVDKVNELLVEDNLRIDMSYKGSKPSCGGDDCVAPTIEEYAFQLYNTWDPAQILDELRVNYVNQGRSK